MSPSDPSVCGKNEYVLIEVGKYYKPCLCSRMLVFKLSGNFLVSKARVDQLRLGIGEKNALEFSGYSGKQIRWVGLTIDDDGLAQLYE